jgi:DNA repair exonuclease SbcCD ATPase subunit
LTGAPCDIAAPPRAGNETKLIEQAIFTAVGFLTAMLLALAAAPAVARRARRLAEARARLLAPLSEAQAIADRDALRAQHAIEIVRLERRLRAAEEAVAARKVEVGRQLLRLVALEDESATGVGDLEAARREANELRGQLGAVQNALADIDVQRDRVEARLDDSETLAEERRGEIAALETRLSALEMRLADAESAAAAAAERAATEHDRLKAALADAEARLARSEAAREEAVLENRRQLERVAERGAAVSNAGATERADRDQALRAAIARLGRDVVRLEGRRRVGEVEPINLAAPLHPAPAGKIRHSEPAAREG